MSVAPASASVLGDTMDVSRGLLRLFGHMIEHAADWHLDYEARVGNQVVAIALRSREGFVLYRGELYLLEAGEVGWLLPGRRLSADESRALFGGNGQTQAARRLEKGAFLSVEIRPEGASGLTRVEVIGKDGGSRGWTFSSLASAGDVVARFQEMGIVDAELESSRRGGQDP